MRLTPTLGSRDQLLAVRQALRAADFSEAEVSRRCGISDIQHFRARRHGREDAREPTDACDALVRLFLDEEPLPWPHVTRLLGDATAGTLRELVLLAVNEATDECHGTVLLYPAYSLHLISDRTTAPADEPPAADLVYPAITKQSGHFMSTLPTSPCDALLELCAGTGLAALVGARRSRHAWAADITARATHFAEFNARLNNMPNVSAVCGDLYEAVAGLTFDRIVAHPPYVPESGERVMYRDGGEDGEQVTRGIVRGLPDHLRPGGTLHCTCTVTDRAGQPFEARVREWLGDRAGEFDVVFLPIGSHEPLRYFVQRALDADESFAMLERQCGTIRRLEVERFVHGSFVIRRHETGTTRPPRTVRHIVTVADVAPLADWLLDWAARAADGAAPGALLDAPVAATCALTFTLVHALVDGAWQATACRLQTHQPLRAEFEVPPWTAALLVRCDGTQSVRAIIADLVADEIVPAGFETESIAPLLVTLVGLGALTAPGWPPPPGVAPHAGGARGH